MNFIIRMEDNMSNSILGKVLITVTGVLVIGTCGLLDKMNMLNHSTLKVMLLVLVAYAMIYYFYFRMYKVRNSDDYAKNNNSSRR